MFSILLLTCIYIIISFELNILYIISLRSLSHPFYCLLSLSLDYKLAFSVQFLAMVFQDLLTNKDDYLRASRALLREIIKQTKHEINFQSFCLGLMQERKEASYVDMEFKVSVFHIVGLCTDYGGYL